jgi:hypothetical protein
MSYNSDNGSVAFGDPQAVAQKRDQRKANSKERGKKHRLKTKKNGGIEARQAMHKKFG